MQWRKLSKTHCLSVVTFIENIIKAMRYGIPSSVESHPGLIIGIVSHASLVSNCRDFDDICTPFGEDFRRPQVRDGDGTAAPF